jgi:hypothetical protein
MVMLAISCVCPPPYMSMLSVAMLYSVSMLRLSARLLASFHMTSPATPATTTSGATAPTPAPTPSVAMRLPTAAPDVTIHDESDLIECISISRAPAAAMASAGATASRKRPKPYEYRCRRCHITHHMRCRILDHVRTHADILKLPCTSCGKRFATKASLQRHSRYNCKHRSQGQAADERSHPSPAPVPAATAAATASPAPASAPAPPAPALAPPPVTAPAAAHSIATCTCMRTIPAPGDASFVLFDVADIQQVYPPAGTDLRRCNSIVYSGVVRRSDVYPHLNGQHIVYKNCNPALDATYVPHTLHAYRLAPRPHR